MAQNEQPTVPVLFLRFVNEFVEQYRFGQMLEQKVLIWIEQQQLQLLQLHH
jgi:hypothetical protein